MVAVSEPITRNELDAKLETLASKEDLAEIKLETLASKADLAEIKTDIKWMKWVIGIAIPLLIAAASVPDIIAAIKS